MGFDYKQAKKAWKLPFLFSFISAMAVPAAIIMMIKGPSYPHYADLMIIAELGLGTAGLGFVFSLGVLSAVRPVMAKTWLAVVLSWVVFGFWWFYCAFIKGMFRS